MKALLFAVLTALPVQSLEAPDRTAEAGPAVGGVAASAAVHRGSERQLDVANPWIAEADIRIDGRLDDSAWAAAPLLTGFTQFEPVEGADASQRTEVRILVTDDAVYLAVRAFDRDPAGIRATLARRDDYGRTDDYVRVVLDTFNDQRRAFVFQVNPLGIQADGLWVEGRGGRGGPVDWNPDFLWESAGMVASDGFTAEMRIPFKSVRFPALPIQDWGLQITRRIQRNGYESSWAPLSSNQANALAQSGRLRGLRDLDPGLFMEINPVLTGSRVGAFDEDAEALRRDPASGDFGLNLTYGLTSNLTLDGTFNPDFSQVEADAGQITVNERFALRLPEKRPFFLEGTDVFSMPQQLVYTRSIVNPVGATKVSGKVGGLSVAYLGAVDDVSGSNPLVNLVRVKGDVGRSSTVGMVYTDRTLRGQDFNRVFGADARFVLADRYALEVLASGSADGRAGQATDWGSLFLARFNRSSRSLSVSGSFEDVSDAFRARSGFLRRHGVSQADARVGYTFRGDPGAFVENWGPSVDVEGTWNRDDFWSGRGAEEAEVQLNLSGSFRGNVGGFLSLSRSAYSFGPERYEGLFVGSDGEPDGAFAPSSELFQGLHAVRLRSWISRWDRIRFSFGGSWSETPIFERFHGLPADLGQSWGADADVTLQPTGAIQASVGLRHSTLLRKRDGSTYSSATIPRLEARYQFSRSLFVRGIGEYAFQKRGDVLDPVTGRTVLACDDGCAAQTGSDRYDMSIEGLVGYEPSPGTVFFLGYSRQMRDTAGFRFQDVRTRADGLFVKLSYRFRM